MPNFDAKKALKERDKKIQKQEDELEALRKSNTKAETELSELSEKFGLLEKRLGGGKEKEDKFKLVDDDYTKDGGLKPSGIEKMLSKRMSEIDSGKPATDEDIQKKINETLSAFKRSQLEDKFDLKDLISDEDGDFYKYASKTAYNSNDPDSGTILENIIEFEKKGDEKKIMPIMRNYQKENGGEQDIGGGFSSPKSQTPTEKNQEKEIKKLKDKASKLLKEKKFKEAMQVDDEITQLQSEGA